jgi:hypothetical protein
MLCAIMGLSMQGLFAQTEEVPELHFSFDHEKYFLSLTLVESEKDIIGYLINKKGEEFYLSGVYENDGKGIFTLRPSATMEDYGIGFLEIGEKEVTLKFTSPKTGKTGIPKNVILTQLGCCKK